MRFLMADGSKVKCGRILCENEPMHVRVAGTFEKVRYMPFCNDCLLGWLHIQRASPFYVMFMMMFELKEIRDGKS